MFGAKMPKHI